MKGKRARPKKTDEAIPAWLLDLPDGEFPAPPVDTRQQLLPFEKLEWRNFERLCLVLAREDGNIEACRLYGEPGQEQQGIDLYAKTKEKTGYTVWQAKNHAKFEPADLNTAVDEFLAGKWAKPFTRFILATGCNLISTQVTDRIEHWRGVLRKKNIDFEPYDGKRLSELLKHKPGIVEDFFGDAWLERFCGRDAATSISRRLQRNDVVALRKQLLDCYRAYFSTIDPGLLSPAIATSGRDALPLEERFVFPDLAALATGAERADIQQRTPAEAAARRRDEEVR
jgi:hypothetical protein